MAEHGKVFEILKDGKAKVAMVRHEACKHCHACDMGKSEEMTLTATMLCDVKVGDTVEVHLETKDFLKATSILYGIPLLTLMVGFGLGYYVAPMFNFNQDLFSFIVGLVFLGITYAWIKSKEEVWKSQNYEPVILKVVE